MYHPVCGTSQKVLFAQLTLHSEYLLGSWLCVYKSTSDGKKQMLMFSSEEAMLAEIAC